jgi:hypothetical protein
MSHSAKHPCRDQAARFNLALSQDEIYLLLGALAGAIEDDPLHDAPALQKLCALHGRVSASLGFKPDYVFLAGRARYASTGGAVRPGSAGRPDPAGCDD